MTTAVSTITVTYYGETDTFDVTVTPFTVTFDSNGGSAVKAITTIAGTITAPTTTTTAGGATKDRFRGWYTDNGTFETLFDFTTTPITADITLYADWGYRVGDAGPGGGIIAYRATDVGFTLYMNATDTGTPAHYLEAAPAGWNGTDNDPSVRWASFDNDFDKEMVAGTSEAIGTGRRNTALILTAASGFGTPATEAPAAYLCSTYSTPTAPAGEWFLPSRYEAVELLNAGIISSNNWWTSTQAPDSDDNIVTGSGAYERKQYETSRTRPIRAF